MKGTKTTSGDGVPPVIGRLLTPAEVAAAFRVDPKTVGRWAKAGRLTSIRTPGGHRRYLETEIRALTYGQATPAQARAGTTHTAARTVRPSSRRSPSTAIRTRRVPRRWSAAPVPPAPR
ncbi:hypothetical protein GCM10017673_45080 [Streptosporangium violaceochromogenes]|nr:hypothetical protein GCM10017673_45080 [Streptosporangium violaceochromogenes]